MARIPEPSPLEVNKAKMKAGLKNSHLRWKTRRAYQRVDGVFRGIGWFIEYRLNTDVQSDENAEYLFLPD